MVDDLACEQRSHDLDALDQPGGALGLRGPPRPGDVLVRGLPGAERDPQATGEHLAQRGSGLSDDRRVVALPRRVDHSERQLGGGQRSAEERPGEPRLALALAPGREVVGAHRRREAGPLGMGDRREQLARRNLLV